MADRYAEFIPMDRITASFAMQDNNYVVVCVDDEDDSRAVIESAAVSLGFTPVGLRTVEEAVAYIADHHHEVVMVLADYNLGAGETGLEIRRQTSQFYEIPFVVVSGYVSREMALEGLGCKVETFLDKPLDRKAFAERIASAVAARKDDLDFKAEVKATFLEEADGLLEELENMLLALESSPGDLDLFNGVFRIVHTVKGSSSVLDTQDVSSFAHKFEDYMQGIRGREKSLSAHDLHVLFQGLDGLRALIECARSGSPPPLSQLNFDSVEHAESSAALASSGQPDLAGKEPASRLVKVPLEVLDRLEHHAAEVTIQKNMISKLVAALLREQPSHAGIAMLSGFFDEMVKHHAVTQSEIAKIRTTPFSEIARPMTRLVRDLEKSLKKSAHLTVIGGQILIDYRAKKLMTDCFVHLIRNCMDHGIEPVETRKQNGKSEISKIRMEARQKGRSIEIVIEDDGRGIDPNRIREKAAAKNLVSETELKAMTDAQVIDLIFAPGFSTAEQISDTSGRGVGMDMVRTSLQDIGGSVSVSSTFGVGTTVRLLIPKQDLALSIDSLLVRAGDAIFAIAQQSIIRLCDLNVASEIKSVEHEGALSLVVNGELVPMISLEAFLTGKSLQMSEADFANRASVEVLIVQDQMGPTFAIQVDEILDIEEVVIRPIEGYVDIQGLYKGAALLNDGSVGLILDVAAIASRVRLSDHGEIMSSQNIKNVEVESSDRYLLVESAGEEMFAIRQEDVFRVETIRRSDVMLTGGRSVLRYRDHIASLTTLAMHLDMEKSQPLKISDGKGSEEISVVAIRANSGFHIYEVKKIVDVVEIERRMLLASIGQDDRFLGHFFYGDQMYSVVRGDILHASSIGGHTHRGYNEAAAAELKHG